MNNTKFKTLLKESLKDSLSVVQASCQEMPGLTICDLLGPDKTQKLIDAGEIIRNIEAGQKFTPQDAEYIINLISVAKRELGPDDVDVINFETAVKRLMNLSEGNRNAMECLKENFSKFKLSQMLESVSLEFLMLILFVLFLAVSACVWYDQE